MAEGQDLTKEAKQSLFMIADKIGKEVKNGTFEDIDKEQNFANVMYYLERMSICSNGIVPSILLVIFSTIFYLSGVINFKGLYVPLGIYLIIVSLLLFVKYLTIKNATPFKLLKSLSSDTISEDILKAVLEKANFIEDEKIVKAGKKLILFNLVIVGVLIVIGSNTFINPFIYLALIIFTIITINNKAILYYANK